MTAAAVRPPRAAQALAKILLFALVALMILVVLHKDRVIADPADPIWDHYRPFQWWLLPHGIAGVLALFLGLLQFSSRLRRKLPRHRLIGRIYVCAVAVLVPLGIVIEEIKYASGVAPLRLLVATSGFGTIFALTTATGYAMARRHNIAAHRRWMTRSYAVSLVFLEVRCVDQIPFLTRLMDGPSTLLETRGISDMWFYVLLSLAGAEIVLRSEARLRGRARQAQRSPG